MSANIELHVMVPGLCGPLAELHSLKDNAEIHRCIKNLSRANCEKCPDSLFEVVAGLFQLSIDSDFPTAALSLYANDKFDASLFYMSADPVHLRADLDHAVLSSSLDLMIKEQESEILCDALNRHFSEDGLSFFRLNKDRWFVSSRDKIQLSTTPLSDATGRNVNFLLPEGENSSCWKKILTEAQMLLHAHEVNTLRENAALQSINSLWFHGSGELPLCRNTAVVSVCSENDVFAGLAAHAKCEHLRPPDCVDDYIKYLLHGRQQQPQHGPQHEQRRLISLLHLADLEHVINYTDVSIWLQVFSAVMTQWLYPLLETTRRNNITMVLYPGNGRCYRFTRYHALRFWKNSTLDQHFCTHRSYAR